MAHADAHVDLLGPLEVRVDGALVHLTGRMATLLATLALNLGCPMPYRTLGEFLWPDGDGPSEPRRTLQTYASRLRDVLGRSAVVAHADGLRLNLDRDRVDLCRFRDLVAAADDARDELEPLAAALTLWRGAPLSGLSPDALESAEGPALVEELLGVTERVHDLRVRRGQIDETLIASLRRLVADHPWRERSWRHLMLALYRLGRQGEALAAFATLVSVLREDLGVVPGAEAARLHQQMLARDPELLMVEPPTRPASSRLPVPAQLPAGVPIFVGRSGELAALDDLLAGPARRSRVALVTGPPGIGKTTTAIESAHRVRDAYPDGQLFALAVRNGVAVRVDELLDRFIRDLGVDPGDVPAGPAERAALFRSICAQRRVLIVIDDAQTPEQVAALLPGAGGSSAIVTARQRCTDAANLHLDLTVMPPTESQHLLEVIVGADRLAAEKDEARAIVAACAGSPLALRIVGGRLAARPTWSIGYVADRVTGPDRLAELSHAGQSVRAVLETAMNGAEPELSASLRELAAIPAQSVDVDSAAVVWQVDTVAARQRLEELTDIRLLEPAAPGLYTWHDLIDIYVRAHAPVGALGTQRRVLRRHIASLANAKDLFRPDDRPHHVVVHDLRDDNAVAFSNQAEVHRWLHSRTPILVSLVESGLVAGGDHAVEAAAMSVLLDTVAVECCHAEDLSERLLRAVVDADLPPSAAHFNAAAHHNLAVVLAGQGRLAEARTTAYAAIREWQSLGDAYGEITMVNNLGRVHARLGEYAAAREMFRRCVDADEVLPPSLRARTMLNLAQAHASLGDATEALTWVASARALSRPAPMSVEAHEAFLVESSAYAAAADERGSVAAAEASLAVARAVESALGEAMSLVALARARRLAGLESSAAAAEAGTATASLHHWQTRIEALVELAHAHRIADDRVAARASAAEAARLLDTAGLADTALAATLLADLP